MTPETLTPTDLQVMLNDLSLDPELRAKLELLLQATLSALAEQEQEKLYDRPDTN